MQSHEDKELGAPKPLVVHFTKNKPSLMPEERQPLVVQKSSPFPYKDDRTIPWRYNMQVLDKGKSEEVMNKVVDSNTLAISNISGIDGMTRSARIFTPPSLTNYKGKDKNDEKAITNEAKKFLKGNEAQTEDDSKKEKGLQERKFLMMKHVKFSSLLNKVSIKWLTSLIECQLGSLC